jgi:hypothetical protein
MPQKYREQTVNRLGHTSFPKDIKVSLVLTLKGMGIITICVKTGTIKFCLPQAGRVGSID